MSTVRPGFLSKNTFELCSDLGQLDKNIESINPSDYQIAGGRLLKTLLDESDFPEPVPILDNNPISFSLSTHQHQLVKAACKIIRKTNLYLQNIEQNLPKNMQLVTFSVLNHHERRSENNDPRHDPSVLYHRWVIRSKSSIIDFGSELDPNENSVEFLEALLESLDRDITGYVEGTIPKTSLSYDIHTIFRIQLSYELGEYYFSRDIGKSESKSRWIKLLGSLESFLNVAILLFTSTIDKNRLSALIKGTGFLTKKFPPSIQLEYFSDSQDYESVFMVLFKSFANDSTYSIPLADTRVLLNEAIKLGQEYAAVKIAFYNAFKLPSHASAGNHALAIKKFGTDEEVIIKVLELLKAKYGNFFGQSLSENQRKFISLFLQKIEKDEIWRILRKIEGLEFVQYPVEHIIEKLALLNANCKIIKAENDEYKLSMKTLVKKACMNCHDAKIKCTYLLNDAFCQRCTSMGFECIPNVRSKFLHKGKEITNAQDNFNVPSPKNIQPLPLPQVTNLPSIFTTVNQNARKDRSVKWISFSSFMGPRKFVNSTVNDDQVQWKNIEGFIKSSFSNDRIEDEGLAHIERMIHDALNNGVLLCLSVLVPFMIVIHSPENDLEETHRREFDIILRMDTEELKKLQTSARRLIKSMDSAEAKNIELALDTLAKLKNIRWAHHIVASLIAGHLCNRKARREQLSEWLNMELNEQTPSIYRKNYTAEGQGKQHQNSRHQNINVKYRLRYDASCLPIDETKQEIEVEEFKREFLHELTELVDEGNERKKYDGHYSSIVLISNYYILMFTLIYVFKTQSN
ncbi:13905_t:CDS:10 [Acaulospora colombiana]|uniref:13905_t:CDS:1 n=1 Tax=Acaulospora colombiana TaxID=27376 RepID=A0ACA9LGV0_9GLOM|nr:13905_t:CDS:10 [Acaulospora colombiana]